MWKTQKSEKTLLEDLINNPRHFKRMNAPDAASCLKGPCGDEMEFYLVFENNKIKDISFFTNGCEATIACGEIVCCLAEGKALNDALGLNPRQVSRKLKQLDAAHKHCPILAVSALYNAIAQYMLMP